MHIHLPALSGIILTYLLVFARVGAMVMLLPAIGEMGVPARVRLVLALAIAFALTPHGAKRLSRRRAANHHRAGDPDRCRKSPPACWSAPWRASS